MNHLQKKLQHVGAQFQRKALEDAIKTGFENGYALGLIDGRRATLSALVTALNENIDEETKKFFADEIAKLDAQKENLLAKAQEPK